MFISFPAMANDEIVFNGLKNIINNSRRCDFAFIIPVVILFSTRFGWHGYKPPPLFYHDRRN